MVLSRLSASRRHPEMPDGLLERQMPHSFLVDRSGKARVTPFLSIDNYLSWNVPSCLVVLTMQFCLRLLYMLGASISSPQLLSATLRVKLGAKFLGR